MISEQFLMLLNDLDDELVANAKITDSSSAAKVAKKKTNVAKRGLRWPRIVAIAACLLLIVSTALIILPMLRGGGPVNPPDTTGSVALVQSGSTITGKQELFYGNTDVGEGGNADMAAPGFEIQTVIEAEIIEVLPDTYYYAAGYYLPLYVARVRVVDQIRGEGLPGEIFLCYPYYDRSVFDGFERFIMSLEQTGVENYMLVNDTQGRVDYFSNMFEVTLTRDLGYGSVIAFNDGRVDSSFWDNTDHLISKVNIGKSYFDNLLSNPDYYYYPASKNSTLLGVRSNILALSADKDNYHVRERGCDYVTLDDIFVTEEAQSLRSYLEPTEKSVFMQEIIVNPDRTIAFYTRVINGFLTNEEIIIGGYNGEAGNILRMGDSYPPETLDSVPDIGAALAELDLSTLSPPHIEITETMSFSHSSASAVYRLVDGAVYGIVRVIWNYKHSNIENAYQKDDMYYLYDGNGQGRVLERDELRAIIGDDIFILKFPYNATEVWD